MFSEFSSREAEKAAEDCRYAATIPYSDGSDIGSLTSETKINQVMCSNGMPVQSNEGNWNIIKNDLIFPANFDG